MKFLKKTAPILMLLLLTILLASCRGDASDGYKLTFVVDGEVYESAAVSDISSFTLPPEPFAADKSFYGWYLDDVSFSDEFRLDELTSGLTSDITVYAKFGNPLYGVEVNYIGHGNASYKVEKGASLPEEVMLGAGWEAVDAIYRDEALTQPWYPEDKVYSDTVLYATVREREFEITFVDGETVVSVQRFTKSTEIINLPQLPMKEGYSVAWEPFVLTYRDIIVRAIYTPLP